MSCPNCDGINTCTRCGCKGSMPATWGSRERPSLPEPKLVCLRTFGCVFVRNHAGVCSPHVGAAPLSSSASPTPRHPFKPDSVIDSLISGLTIDVAEALHDPAADASPETPPPQPAMLSWTDAQLDGAIDNTLADLSLAQKYEHNDHLLPAIRAMLDRLNAEKTRRQSSPPTPPTDAKRFCGECGTAIAQLEKVQRENAERFAKMDSGGPGKEPDATPARETTEVINVLRDGGYPEYAAVVESLASSLAEARQQIDDAERTRKNAGLAVAVANEYAEEQQQKIESLRARNALLEQHLANANAELQFLRGKADG